MVSDKAEPGSQSSEDQKPPCPDWQRQQWQADYEQLWRNIDRFHARRNSWNTLFLSVNTALLAGGVGALLEYKSVPGAVLASVIGLATSILWALINGRMDVDTDMTWAQLRELECALGKQRVAIAKHGRTLFHPSESRPLPPYLNERDLKICWLQSVSVKTALLWLSVVSFLGHAFVLCWAVWRLKLRMSPEVQQSVKLLVGVFGVMIGSCIFYWVVRCVKPK